MGLLISCGVFHPKCGGAESLFFDLSSALADDGYAITVLTRHFEGLPMREEIAGFRIVREDWPIPYEYLPLDLGLLWKSPGALLRTYRLLRDEQIDTVVIGLLDMSAAYLLALRPFLGFRLITYLHGAEIRDLPQASHGYKAMAAVCMRASDAIVACSPSLAAEALRVHPRIEPKLSVIPNGIDFAALDRAPAAIRPRPYILYAGRLADEKNVDCIVRAFAQAHPKMPEVDLVIAGTGPEGDAIAELVESTGSAIDHIDLLGVVERAQVLGLVKNALFLVLASDKESHSIAMLEAFSAGKMVLASNVVGLNDVIEDGVNGALFPLRDDQALAELMHRYARDEAARIAIEENISQADRSRFDLNKSMSAHRQLIAP